MLRISKQTTEDFLARLAALGERIGASQESLQRLEQGLLVLGDLDPTRPKDPYQNPNFFLPGLTAKPFWDSSQFGWTSRLEASYETIMRELLQLRGQHAFGLEPETDLVEYGTWAQFDFRIGGRKLTKNCEKCPETTAILDSIEEAKDSDLMLFSAHAPGTHIKPHCGPHNARIRCHFALTVPENCYMRVGNETRTWEPGKCLVFDDSFEHEVWNRGRETRIVLLLDVWHPEVTEIERIAIRSLMQALKSAALNETEKGKVDRWSVVEDPSRQKLPENWWF